MDERPLNVVKEEQKVEKEEEKNPEEDYKLELSISYKKFSTIVDKNNLLLF